MKPFYLLFLLFCQQISAQQSAVLFLGNSYTYSNNLPDLLYQLSLAGGDSILHDSNTPGGYTFQMHTTDANSLSKINSRPWNYVILQGQSQEPALDTPYVVNNVFPYATQLNNLIQANDSCTQTIYFMTWGRKNGDASNCVAYPPVCTFAGMQDQLRGRYVQMAQDNNAIVAPVGEAWKNVIATNPAFDLYSPDESHPSIYGSYLTACVFYATIYRESPAGLNFYGGLPQNDALLLQTIAGNTVLDSMNVWNTEVYYPDAGYSVIQVAQNVITVTANDPSAISWSWDDGTGNGFVAGNASETFTYAVTNNYNICLAVSNGCRADTFCMMVNPATVGIVENNSFQLNIFPNPSNGKVNVSLPGKLVTIKLVDVAGNIVFEKVTAEKILSIENLSAGIYFAEVQNDEKTMRTKLIVIH